MLFSKTYIIYYAESIRCISFFLYLLISCSFISSSLTTYSYYSNYYFGFSIFIETGSASCFSFFVCSFIIFQQTAKALKGFSASLLYINLIRFFCKLVFFFFLKCCSFQAQKKILVQQSRFCFFRYCLLSPNVSASLSDVSSMSSTNLSTI